MMQSRLQGQSAFIISLEDGDTEHSLRFIGIKDEKQGYLKYLNVEKEHYRYSLDAVIEDIYGSLEEYAATWPEDQRHLFYDDPKGSGIHIMLLTWAGNLPGKSS